MIPDKYEEVLKDKMNDVTRNILKIRDRGFGDLGSLLVEVELSLHCIVEEAYYLGVEDGKEET